MDKFRSIKIFGGSQKEYEEFGTKFRSQVSAGNVRVFVVLKAVETNCTQRAMANGNYDEGGPGFAEQDEDFIRQSDREMYNLLLNMSTGEGDAMVRRCPEHGWLAWKRLTSC